MDNRPNVVWIYLDQCRADVLGCYGPPFVRTPNLDRLAREGVLFENAFCQNPVCVPSRVSALSGMYPHHTDVWHNHDRMRAEDSLLLGRFRESGYVTANVGKLHLGIPPRQAGFDVHRAILHDGIPHFRVPDDYPADCDWKTFSNPGYPEPIIYATDMCPRERTYSAVGVDHAIDILASHNSANGPLLLRLSLDRPHTPVTSPAPYSSMYAEHTALPVYTEREAREQAATVREYLLDRNWHHFTDEEVLKVRYHYFGLMTHLDCELGRLLAAVKDSPEAAETIVVLAADHGCMLGEHGLYVKGPHYYTETSRVPFLVAWPGRLLAGCRIGGLVEMVDLLPTLCELCGLPTPDRAVGRSLLPVIRGEEPGRRDVFAEQHYPKTDTHWEALRTEEYSYTRYSNGQAMLFDLRQDPEERRNLMPRSAPTALLRELDRRLDQRRES